MEAFFLNNILYVQRTYHEGNLSFAAISNCNYLKYTWQNEGDTLVFAKGLSVFSNNKASIFVLNCIMQYTVLYLIYFCKKPAIFKKKLCFFRIYLTI
jgi:hypothetical protein